MIWGNKVWFCVAGHGLGIWICGCSLFYRRDLWASKFAGFNSTKSLKICGCKRWCPKDLRVCAPAEPMLKHSLVCSLELNSKSKTQILNCINKTILWQGPFLVNDTIKESQTLPNFCSFWNGRTHLPTAGLWQKIALLHLGCLHHFLLICLIFKYVAK